MADDALNPEDRRTSSAFERHLQTGLVVLVVGVMSWVGVSVNETSRSMATMQERVSWMSDSIKDLKTQLAETSNGRYTINDAERDKALYDRRLVQVERRIEVIERSQK